MDRRIERGTLIISFLFVLSSFFSIFSLLFLLVTLSLLSSFFSYLVPVFVRSSLLLLSLASSPFFLPLLPSLESLVCLLSSPHLFPLLFPLSSLPSPHLSYRSPPFYSLSPPLFPFFSIVRIASDLLLPLSDKSIAWIRVYRVQGRRCCGNCRRDNEQLPTL